MSDVPEIPPLPEGPSTEHAGEWLRGAGPDGLPSLEVGARMVARVPDITRLLDRLEEKDLVRRERSTEDRRVIIARLTRKGEQLLASLDEPVLEMNKQLLGHLSRKDLAELSRLLEAARCSVTPDAK